jgi:hypothetical protein
MFVSWLLVDLSPAPLPVGEGSESLREVYTAWTNEAIVEYHGSLRMQQHGAILAMTARTLSLQHVDHGAVDMPVAGQAFLDV